MCAHINILIIIIINVSLIALPYITVAYNNNIIIFNSCNWRIIIININ